MASDPGVPRPSFCLNPKFFKMTFFDILSIIFEISDHQKRWYVHSYDGWAGFGGVSVTKMPAAPPVCSQINSFRPPRNRNVFGKIRSSHFYNVCSHFTVYFSQPVAETKTPLRERFIVAIFLRLLSLNFAHNITGYTRGVCPGLPSFNPQILQNDIFRHFKYHF